MVEDVGCIRAAAYQGEAFTQARMDVLEQQGVVQGNQAPADHDTGQQVFKQLHVPALLISPCLPNSDSCAAVCFSVLTYCTAGNLLVPGAHQLPFRLTLEGSGCLLGQLEHQCVALLVNAPAFVHQAKGEPVGHTCCPALRTKP